MAPPAAPAALRVIPMRDDALLVELPGLAQTLALLDALEAQDAPGIGEIIPAARTLLIRYAPHRLAETELIGLVRTHAGGARRQRPGALVEIPVRYGGADLAAVASLLEMSPAEVVRRHTQGEYVAAFTGFAPGFAYLSGGDPRLHVQRRASPRTAVPAGAVALAGEFSGVYPKASPGGWQLIGSTPLVMFDPDRDPPSLLRPGMRVRFTNMADAPPATGSTPPAPKPAPLAAPVPPWGAAIEVVSLALPVLFQDLGRPGHAGEGIGISGAADKSSLKAANRLVGNPPGAAALEIALGGLRFRMHGRGVMALAGADAPVTIRSADGTHIRAPHHAAVALDDGDLVALGPPRAGLRSYLALRGGFAVRRVIGSAARDTLAGIGPPPLEIGQYAAIAPAASAAPVTMGMPAFALPEADAVTVLDVCMGPRSDWFTPESVAAFLAQDWQVTPLSNRIGLRLCGPKLQRRRPGELPSEPTLPGALQIPPDGQPVLFLVDHPLTGGYPVIATIAAHHLDRAGQVPVGARLRFHPIRAFAPQDFPERSP